MCSDCYNGCGSISPDKCIKYTGIDVPLLDIKKGDSLSWITQALVTFLTSTINGSGIKINLEEDDYCELVSQYLQECQDVTALDLFKALTKAACNLQSQIDSINETIGGLESDYDVDCLEDVEDSSNTHLVLQAVINKLCEVDATLTQLAVDLEADYVKIADINDYIAAYLAAQPITTRYYTRMIPYTAVEYYGSLSFFDVTGAGIAGTAWEQIYLCNGQNNTPDKRGRIPVGAIAGVPGGALDPAVDPSSDPVFNPNYSVGQLYNGSNKVVLTIPQLPIHTHGVNETPHFHTLATAEFASGSSLSSGVYMTRGLTGTSLQGSLTSTLPTVGKTGSTSTGITVQNQGNNQPHDNKQPSVACYYIMYLPS